MFLVKFETEGGPIWLNPRYIHHVSPALEKETQAIIIGKCFIATAMGNFAVNMLPEDAVALIHGNGTLVTH